MSMGSIRFEPAIGAELQIDPRRRKAGHDPLQDMFSDVLGDQMNRRAEALGPERRAARHDRREDRQHPLDHVSARPIRLTIAHPRTVRGEAREADQPTKPVLPDQSGAESPPSDSPSGPAEASAAAEVDPLVTDRLPDTQDDKEQPSDPIATVLVSVVASVPENAAASEVDAVTVLDPTTGLPVPEVSSEQSSEDMADGEVTPEQQIAEAALDAGLSAAVATLAPGATAATSDAGVSQDTPSQQLPAIPGQATATPAAVAGMAEFEAEVTKLSGSAAEPAPVRPAVDIKPRPGPVTRPSTSDVHGSSAQPQSQGPAQPHVVPGLHADAQAELASRGTFDDVSAAGDGSGPGWALHLAQGAAGKRAEFVAQLKQHLQNLPAHEQVAVHIQRAVREGTNKFSIQLSPAELGRIQVKLEIDEEKRVTAAVTVERPSTLELLQRDIKGLERALHDAGLNMDGGDLSFSLGQSGDQEWAQEQSRFGAAGHGDQGGLPAEADQRAAGSGDVLDTATGVVDVQV
jgi:flagellar hook-length control protein FliK